jgi:hypothetical protein
MAINRKQTLESWIEEAVTDAEKDKPCSGFVLVHVAGAESEIDGIKFGSKAWTAEDLASRFMHKAQSYSQELSGAQYFKLLAFYGEKEAGASHPFKVDGEIFHDGMSSEDASPKGMFAQAMRHTEAITRLTYEKDGMLFAQMGAVIKTLAENYKDASHELRDATQIVHELVREKIQRESDNEMKRLEYERGTSERRALMGMVPPALNQLTGREIFPQGYADTKLLDTIGDSLDEDQIAKLATVLKPEQMALIANRFASKLQKVREEREAKERGPNGNGGHHGGE